MLTGRQKVIISVLSSQLQSNSSKELKKEDSTYVRELRHLLPQCWKWPWKQLWKRFSYN